MAAVSIHSSPGLGDAKMELDAGPSAPTSTASGTATPGEMTNGPRPALGNGIDSSSLDRPRSPVKPLPATTAYMPAGAVAEQDRLMARPQVAASKHDRPIDMRAEEDAARRLNVGRVIGSGRFAGTEGRGRRTDLCGPEFRMAMQRRARNHQMTIDDEALQYLSMAAETQLRQLLSSSVSAQQHRTTTSYLHPPPSHSPSSSSSRSRPMWDVSIQSDPNAVMDALNRQAKEAEREFRTSRMNRLAKEHEMERIRERQAAQLSGGGGVSADANGNGSGGGNMLPPPPTTATTPQAESNGEDHSHSHSHSDSPGAHPPSSPDKGAPSPGASSTPTFGGAKKFTKSKKNPKDVSADVQIKMSNATAMRSAGMGKKYSWMSSAPSISSPLSGNKKKGKKAAAAAAEASAAGAGVGETDVGGEEDGATKKRKKTATEPVGDAPGQPNPKSASGKSKRRKMPTMPSRRMVLVGSDAKGEDKFSPDDKCLTVNDLVFALDREKGGQGMGTSDEVVRRVMARPGGPWGMASGRRA